MRRGSDARAGQDDLVVPVPAAVVPFTAKINSKECPRAPGWGHSGGCPCSRAADRGSGREIARRAIHRLKAADGAGADGVDPLRRRNAYSQTAVGARDFQDATEGIDRGDVASLRATEGQGGGGQQELAIAEEIAGVEGGVGAERELVAVQEEFPAAEDLADFLSPLRDRDEPVAKLTLLPSPIWLAAKTSRRRRSCRH